MRGPSRSPDLPAIEEGVLPDPEGQAILAR
jgi:hypothetical protein